MSDADRLRVRDYLNHMMDAIGRIERYVADVADVDDFRRRTIVHDAVVRNLEIIGEAARNVRVADPDFVAAHAAVPWTAMCGMRNRITHGYFDIDLGVVRQTVRNDIPRLRDQIGALARSLDG